MNITLNGKNHVIDQDTPLSAVITGLTGRPLEPNGQAADGRKLGIAVARNAAVVPRSLWAATALADGDDVEIVTAVQGG